MIVRHNAAESRYELDTEHGLAVAVYREQGDRAIFTHTEVPTADRPAVSWRPSCDGIRNTTTSADRSSCGHRQEGGGSGGCGHSGAPGEIDEAHRERPATQRGEVRQVIGGVDAKAEQRAEQRRRNP